MLASLFSDFLSLIFPEYCLGCQTSLVKGELDICTRCLAELPETNYHQDLENPVRQKFWGVMEVEYAFSYLKFIRGGTVQHLMHQLKYEGKEDLGELLGRLYGTKLKKAGFTDKFDLILPVPLHKSRLRQRGYNQCDPIVRGLSETLEIEHNTKLLKRKIGNISQTKTKNRAERQENVKGIFDLTTPSLIEGKRILLVDDVLTTGATLVSCAQPIFEANCKSLSIATIAVATN